MIRALLFDIGNVLLKFDFSVAMKKIVAQAEGGNSLEVLARFDQVKAAYEDGQIDRAAFLRGAFDVLRYRGTEAEFVAAWQDIFTLNEPMAALVEKLQGRYPLYLLSNTNDLHREYFFRQYPVFQRFTGGVYSDVARTSKPGAAIYGMVQRELGLEPASTFFIDDLLPNIEAARALGFHAHHYHYDRHGALLADLAAAGVECGETSGLR
jgi:putative hydrolase of the HAD superfamily